jgi:YesN/AraC family two-component response regulator
MIVTDINMPEMDGFEMLMTARGEGCAAPAMIISAFLSASFIDRARRMGVHAVLEKPPLLGDIRDNLKQMESMIAAV